MHADMWVADRRRVRTKQKTIGRKQKRGTADDADTRGWAISSRRYLSARIRVIRGLAIFLVVPAVGLHWVTLGYRSNRRAA
jgi:hypothetical protein